jgi:oligopeptide/dipeptide ABC transporter ATP-binding protein
MNNTLLSIENLKTYFSTSHGLIKAVDDISLEIRKGESVGLVGESGSGKSVTALSIMRLIPSPPGEIVDGKILFNGDDLVQKKLKEMQTIRGSKIAMCFQDPMTFLNPVITVGEQIAESIILHKKVTKNEAIKKAIEAMELVQIPSASSRAYDYPHNLSGGMRQRVLIASAISCEPELLIADEPTTALDVITQADILDLIIDLRKKISSSILLITHDLGIVAQICDYIYVMYNGKILESGPVKELFRKPLHPYTAGLLNSLPKLHGKVRKKLKNIPGMIPNPINPPKGCRFHPRCEFTQDICKVNEPRLLDCGGRRSVACHFVDVLNGGKNNINQ